MTRLRKRWSTWHTLQLQGRTCLQPLSCPFVRDSRSASLVWLTLSQGHLCSIRYPRRLQTSLHFHHLLRKSHERLIHLFLVELDWELWPLEIRSTAPGQEAVSSLLSKLHSRFEGSCSRFLIDRVNRRSHSLSPSFSFRITLQTLSFAVSSLLTCIQVGLFQSCRLYLSHPQWPLACRLPLNGCCSVSSFQEDCFLLFSLMSFLVFWE